jgi:hypothetical protein
LGTETLSDEDSLYIWKAPAWKASKYFIFCY